MPASPSPAPPTPPRRQVAIALTALVAVAIVVAGTQLALYHHPVQPARTAGRAAARGVGTTPADAGTRAPRALAASPSRGDGCPYGAEPYLNITAAKFEPRLDGGTHFRPGTYRVTLTGTVVNETTGAIRITALHPQVGGRAWQAHVVLPASLPADAEGRVVITGTYLASRREQANAGAQLSWAWADQAQARCGTRGLVEDD